MLLQSQPPGFKSHAFEFEVIVPASNEAVWTWLNDTRTFTDTQYWPFKVEFYSPSPDSIPNGFNEGVVTNHHGPFLGLPGELVKITPNAYRDLQYYYGSYALSFRWIRPYRLEFWTEPDGSQTKIRCKLSSYVKPWIARFWTKAQAMFWLSFKRWSRKAIPKLEGKMITELGKNG